LEVECGQNHAGCCDGANEVGVTVDVDVTSSRIEKVNVVVVRTMLADVIMGIVVTSL